MLQTPEPWLSFLLVSPHVSEGRLFGFAQYVLIFMCVCLFYCIYFSGHGRRRLLCWPQNGRGGLGAGGARGDRKWEAGEFDCINLSGQHIGYGWLGWGLYRNSLPCSRYLDMNFETTRLQRLRISQAIILMVLYIYDIDDLVYFW